MPLAGFQERPWRTAILVSKLPKSRQAWQGSSLMYSRIMKFDSQNKQLLELWATHATVLAFSYYRYLQQGISIRSANK